MWLKLVVSQIFWCHLELGEDVWFSKVDHGFHSRCLQKILVTGGEQTCVIWNVWIISDNGCRYSECLWSCNLRHLLNVILDMLFNINLRNLISIFTCLCRDLWPRRSNTSSVLPLACFNVLNVLINFLLSNLLKTYNNHVWALLTIGIETTKSFRSVYSALRSCASWLSGYYYITCMQWLIELSTIDSNGVTLKFSLLYTLYKI